jgi:hypothetical protein
VARNGLTHSAVLFHFTSPPSRSFVPSHSNRALHVQWSCEKDCILQLGCSTSEKIICPTLTQKCLGPIRGVDTIGRYGTTTECNVVTVNFFVIGILWGGVQLGPLVTAATNRSIVPAPGDYDDGEIGGLIGRGNRSTRRKPAQVSLCPPQTPHAARTRTRAAAVGSQQLTS